ncbi:MAG: 50S ribosomal protein L4 [Candidatus Micrarchaeia archaeon]|jgi:large subunit ribosomal protein L4e
MTKAKIYSVAGVETGSVELPALFDEPIRRDLIARAVLAEETLTLQPKAAFKMAGLQTSAEYRGRKEDYRSIKNHGISRLPREKLQKGRFGKVRKIPFAVGGRRAFPPNVNKILVEKINEKEKKKAIRSALAASSRREVVEGRGHKLKGIKSYPIIVENSFEAMARTKDVVGVLGKLGFSLDMARAQKGKHVSGIMANRRGGTRRPKSLVIIVGEDKGIVKGGRNIAGVDVITVDKISAKMLAPGAHAGRLALYSASAIEKLKAW